MSDFMKIGDICDILNGYAFKSSKYVDDGIRVIRITNVQKGFVEDTNPQYYPVSEQWEIEKYMLHEGDLLISLTGNVGRVGLLSAELLPAALNQRVACIRIRNPAVIYKPFLFHLLNSDYFENRCIFASQGVAQKNMSTEWLKEYQIPSFSMDKQMEIASIFDKIDALIVSRKEQVRNLDQVVKSRFIELFGDPVTNPYGWQQLTVNDVCVSVVRGPFGSALKKEFFVPPSDTTYKVYEQKHAIQKSSTIGTYYVTAEKYNELRRFECHSGDILMSCSGTMGELYQLPAGCERGIINQALCKFTLNERILPIVFLAYMRETIGNLETKGSGIQNIAAVSYVKAMPINLPPMRVQEQFAAFVEQTDKSKLCGRMEVAA